MHREFFQTVCRDLDEALRPRCDCPCVPERKVTSLVVMAIVDGEPFVYSPPEVGVPDAQIADLVDTAKSLA